MNNQKKQVIAELLKNHYQDYTIKNFKNIDDEQFKILWETYKRNPNCFENKSWGFYLIYGD